MPVVWCDVESFERKSAFGSRVSAERVLKVLCEVCPGWRAQGKKWNTVSVGQGISGELLGRVMRRPVCVMCQDEKNGDMVVFCS